MVGAPLHWAPLALTTMVVPATVVTVFEIESLLQKLTALPALALVSLKMCAPESDGIVNVSASIVVVPPPPPPAAAGAA